MALDLNVRYPNTNPADADFPQGSIKNDTVPGDKTGTPIEKDWLNDYVGFTSALLVDAGVVPSGNVDTALSSDRLRAIRSTTPRKISSVFDTDSFAKSQEGDLVELVEYHPNSGVGGREAVVRSARHNGGTVISLTRVRPTDWGDQAQLTAWFADSGVDELCLVAINYLKLSVYMFGAKYDDVTDDTLSHKSAIKSLSEGGDIYLGAGTSLILDTLRDDILDPTSVGKTITLIGVGSSEDQSNSGEVTTLRTTGGRIIIKFDGNRSGGRDFAVKGDGGSLATSAANIVVESSRAQWKNIVSMNSRGSGFWFRFGNNSYFESITCLGNKYRGFDADGTGYISKAGVSRPNDLNASSFINIDVRANADIGFRTGVNSGFSNFYYNITTQGNAGVGCQLNGDFNRIFGFYGEGNGGDLVVSTQILAGYFYEIVTVGTSDFTLIGAPNNDVGTRFIATGSTAGTGTTIESVDIEFSSTADNNFVWGIFANDELAGANFSKDNSSNKRNYVDRLKGISNEFHTQLIRMGENATPNGYIEFSGEGDGTNTSITLEGTSATQQIDITSSGAGQLGINPDFITRESAIAPVLVNGWANFGGSRKVAGYYKTKDNIVHLEGVISGGTATSSTVMFTLPVGYRPAGGRMYFSTTSGAAFASGFIESTGEVYIESGVNTSFSLDSISFKSN